MFETIVVCAIVGIVAVLAGRSLYKTLTGKNDACCCGGESCCSPDGCGRDKAGVGCEGDR
ncbi:MAG: FeoB-associated Cys-rich membrane protein [Acidobacteriota bacterium]|jgi:hypothetical protein|nr:FeoB-associated Cys-rich membrane protein [Acidobacteriota bacterium]